MISKRQLNFLRELIYSKKFYSIQHFANLLQVSSRTIHFDIEAIQSIGKEYNCEIIKKPGKGIFLEGKNTDKVRLLQSLRRFAQYSELSPADRQMQILEMLVNGKRLSYNYLSEKYLVSRTSIAKDFKAIRDICSEDNISLNFDNEGTYLLGSEKDIQSLLKKLFFKKFEKSYYRYPNNIIEYRQFLLETDYQVPHSFVEETFNIISKIGEKFNLADHYLINLQNTLIVLCLRVFRGYHHERQDGYVFEKVRLLETYYIAIEIAEQIKLNLDLSLLEEDIVYLNESLIAVGLDNLNITNNDGYYSQLAKDVIKRFSKIVNTDFSKDEKLYKGILNHIVPMIYRLNNDIHIQNPLIKEIKKQYSVMFDITWFVIIELESILRVHIPEDEIGFIMVHFQSALERNEDIKKVLIISPTGIVTSELLENRIKKSLPTFFLFEVETVKKINPGHLKKFDYIISTVPLQDTDANLNSVFYISPIPTEQELKELTLFMTDDILNSRTAFPFERMDKEDINMTDYLDDHSIFINHNFNTAKDALSFLLNNLEERKYVTLDYRKSLFEREATSSTSLETGVAIPHGNPDFVKKTNISILVNNKKISWGKEKVDVIILLSVAKKDVKKISSIISHIYDLISDRAQIEHVFFNKTKQEIYQYF